MSRYALLFTAALAAFAVADDTGSDCGDFCDNAPSSSSSTTTCDSTTAPAATWDPITTTPVAVWEPVNTWTTSTTTCDDEDDTTTWDGYTWSNVPVTATETGTWGTWSPYPTPSWTGKPWHPHGKGGDKKETIIITITETYEVPCETGWATSTTTVYDTWCGCKETPKPVHPSYSTYTTECPDSWNVPKTVTVTVPVATWTPPAQTSGYVPLASATWVNYPVAAASGSSTWANVPVAAASTSTWSAYGVAATSCAYTTTAIYSTVCSQWAAWDTSKTGAATACATSTSISTIYPTTCTGTWAAYSVAASSTGTWATYGVAASSTGAWSPIGTYKGAASNNGVKGAFVAAAGAVAGLAAML